MKKVILSLCMVLVLYRSATAETHKHDSSKKEEHHDEHAHEASEENHKDDHDDEKSEEGSNVGPDKGITEANKNKGFKLSAEANKNFDLKTMKLVGGGPWTLPSSARMLSQEEENIYRLRDGFIKRIDFNLISKDRSGKMNIKSEDLKEGDEVIIEGVGFVRIAELAAFGGAPEGHSH